MYFPFILSLTSACSLTQKIKTWKSKVENSAWEQFGHEKMFLKQSQLHQLPPDHGAITNLPPHIKDQLFTPSHSPIFSSTTNLSSIPSKRTLTDYFDSTSKVSQDKEMDEEPASLLKEIKEIKASLKRIEQFLGIS
jgi:hypothetical protein